MAKDTETSLEKWQDHVYELDDPAISESLSPYDDDIDRFFGNINDISDRFSNLTKKIVGHTIDTHKHHNPWFQSRDSVDEEGSYGQTVGIDNFFNRPYQTRTSDFFKTPLDFFHSFTDKHGVTPFGLFAYQGPSPRDYNTCTQKEGLSLWDSNGYWRCLFPNSKVPPEFLDYKKKQLTGQIVTKDDFEERAHSAPKSHNGAIDLGAQGTFFRQFGDFLNWKNIQYEEEKKRVESQREERRRRFSGYSYNQSEKTSDLSTGEKNLVGSSVQSSTNSEDGEIVMKEVKTEYFSDGTSVTNNIVKRKPQGASAWASIEEKSEQGKEKQGWFWNSK